jgi:hypothetical protein
MVVEGVFKDSAGLASVIESLKASGYEVTIRLVAVHERHSLLGISSRYEQEKIVRWHGRYVPVDYHNECYQRILQTIDLLESQRLVDRLEIYNRNGDLLYSNLVTNGEWKDPPEGSSAMRRGRDCGLSAKERLEYRESWHSVMALMYKRRASQDEVTQTKALADGLCKAVEEDTTSAD